MKPQRPILLLAAGALVGLATAMAGLLAPVGGARGVPDDAVAVVNGTPLRRIDYERALAAFENDRRDPLDDADRRHILDRLVDEELLVQRAIALELPRRDRRARSDLVAAVIESVTAEAAHREPSPAELEAFFEENRDYFARPGRLRAERVFVRATPDSEDDARARATRAAERLRAGEAAAVVEAEVGDPPVAPLPDALLPATKLREYVGPAPVEALAALEPGAVTEPVRGAGGYLVLRLVEREPVQIPELLAVEPELRAEWRRRQGDAALRGYLDGLREDAAIQTAVPD